MDAENPTGKSSLRLEAVCATSLAILDERAYEQASQSAGHYREQKLLDWLHDPKGQPGTLLAWLGGHEFIIMRNEGPALALARSLPPLTNTAEPAVRSVLVERLAELIVMLADVEFRKKKPELDQDPGTWLQLISLADRICDPETDQSPSSIALSRAVSSLRESFDENGPPSCYVQFSRSFSSLVSRHQCDDNLLTRWPILINAEKDKLLVATPQNAVSGLLSAFGQSTYSLFESKVERFFTLINKDSRQQQNFIREFEDFVKSRSHHNLGFTQLAMARLSSSYAWLPEPAPISVALIGTDDLGTIGQLISTLKPSPEPNCSKNISSYRRIAIAHYQSIIENRGFAKDYQSYARMPGQSKGRLKRQTIPYRNSVTFGEDNLHPNAEVRTEARSVNSKGALNKILPLMTFTELLK